MSQLTLQDAVTLLGAIKAGTPDKSLPLIAGKRVRARTYFVAGKASELENGQALLPASIKKTGVTNFPAGNTFDAGVSVLVVGVRSLFETTAGKTLATAEWKSAQPAIFKNGELTINQAGSGLLFNAPGTDLCETSATAISNTESFRPAVFLFRDQAAIEIMNSVAPGDAADILYRIEFRVYELVEESKA